MLTSPNLNQASKALDPATEQLIHKVVQSILAPAQKGECRCHWIDPQKTPILVWKSAKDKDTLVMKINQQKLIGLARSDKNNELYWKFRDFYEAEATGSTPAPLAPQVPVSKPKTEPDQPETVNFPSPTTAELEAAEQSEEVKKFRERYGTPSNPEGPTGS